MSSRRNTQASFMRRSYSITDVDGLRRRSIWVRATDGLAATAASRLHFATAAVRPTAIQTEREPSSDEERLLHETSPRRTLMSKSSLCNKKWHIFSRLSKVAAFFRHSTSNSQDRGAHGGSSNATPKGLQQTAMVHAVDKDSDTISLVSNGGDDSRSIVSIASSGSRSSVSSQAEEVDMQPDVMAEEEEFAFSAATYTAFSDYERQQELHMVTHDGHHRLVYVAKPDRYWRARYMAIYDNYVNEAPAEDEVDEDEDETASTSAEQVRDDVSISSVVSREKRQATSRRIFSTLEMLCATPEARESLYRFECAYAAQHGFVRPVFPVFHRSWWRQAKRHMSRG